MLAQKIVLSYSSKVFIQLLQIIASIVVARIAGPTVLGTIAFCLAYVSMFKFFSNMGLSHAHIKLISEGKNESDCIATYSRLKFFTTLIFLIITISFFAIQKFVFNTTFESDIHQIIILIFLIMITIGSLMDIPTNTFAAKTEQAKQDVPDIIRNIFLQFSRVIVVVLGYKALALALVNIFSVILIIPFILYLFKDYYIGNYDKALAKQYITIAFPMMMIGFTTGIILTIDKILLQFFSNSEQVGYYAAGFKIGGFINIIGYSVGLLFFPLFSQAISNNNFNYVIDKIKKFERFSFIFIMPSILFLAIYSDSIVLLVLGENYIPSINILSIVTIAMYINVMNTPYFNIIAGKGLFGLLAKLNMLNLLFYIFILVISIHPKLLDLNATGAAVSLLISNVFIGFIYRINAKKHIEKLKVISYKKYIFFGIISYIIFSIFYNTYKVQYGIAFRIGFICIYFSLIYFIFIILKLIKKEDWLKMIELLNFHKMKTYIGDEIKNKKKN